MTAIIASIQAAPPPPAADSTSYDANSAVEVIAPEYDAIDTARWYVLHSKSRQEKALSRTLTAAGIEHYLPLHRRVSYRRRRKCVVHDPLFVCYLFLRGTKEATYFATATRRVVNVLDVPEQECFVNELHQIRSVLSAGAALSPFHYLTVGRHVRVTAGPFQGIEGMIEQHRPADRLVLQITALGRATSLEIDAGLLEAVDQD